MSVTDSGGEPAAMNATAGMGEFRSGDKTALAFGALLHDIGKVVQRGRSGPETHAVLGAKFLSDDVAPLNPTFEGELGRQVIDQVRLHHASDLRKARVPASSLAYITYFADNVSAGIDRKSGDGQSHHPHFERGVSLQKIFNILKGHHDANTVEHDDYNAIRSRILNNLAAIPVDWRHVNSLLDLLEATTDAVPSSTDTNQLVDISLFDHSKTTAGIAACVYDYLRESGVSDFRGALFARENAARSWSEQMFLLCSLDMSGIQKFIYTISGDGALKQLRARSLYLELLLEHIVDELLDRLHLSRANLMYTGGGHAYLLLPNTDCSKRDFGCFKRELDEWFVQRYRTDLYAAAAYVECSANDLSNRAEDGERYRDLFRTLSTELSEQKAARYGVETLKALNYGEQNGDHSRECRECHRSDLKLDKDEKCTLCSALGRISADLVRRDVFVIAEGERNLILPFGAHLEMYGVDEYRSKKPAMRRVYVKNDWMTGIDLATHIWMGDYTAIPRKRDGQEESGGKAGGVSIADYAEYGVSLPQDADAKPVGIERLGVLRADVDNLGSAFVSGLPARLTSISRTSTLSRALSLFFKSKINEILEKGGYQAQIIYSGGDDLFIIGNWCDIIHAAIDVRQALDEFTGNATLSISAGIGMYGAGYPIARMAEETGNLVDAAKLRKSSDGAIVKNAIALWTEDAVLGWDEFSQRVIPLRNELAGVFERNEKGKAFIYRLVYLLRNYDRAISAPRLAYLLARSFEGVQDGDEISKRLYELAQTTNGRKEMLIALEWYVCETRERG